MVDLSQVPDNELEALQNGQMEKLSDSTLSLLAGQQSQQTPAPQPSPTPAPKAPDMGASSALFKENFNAAHGPIPQQQISNTAQSIPGELPNVPPAPNEKKGEDFTLKDALESGWGMSISGLMGNDKLPEKILPEDAPAFYRIASGAAQLAGDIPAMVAGSIAGGVAGTEVPVVGNIAGAAGGAFALPAAWRKVLTDHYRKGDIQDFGDFYERASSTLLETMKGFTIGVATSGLGAGASQAAEQVSTRIANTFLQSTVKTTSQLSAEVAGMVAVGKAMEWQVPHLQDFTDAAILVGGFHGVSSAVGKMGILQDKLMDIYSKTGMRPDQVALHSLEEPTVKQDLLSDNVDFPRAYEHLIDGHFINPEDVIPLEKDSPLVSNSPIMGDQGEPDQQASFKFEKPVEPQTKIEIPAEEKTPLDLARETIRSQIVGKEDLSLIDKLKSLPAKAEQVGSTLIDAHMQDELLPSIENALSERGKEFYQNRVDRLNPLKIDPRSYALARLAPDYRGRTNYVVQKGTLDFFTGKRNGEGLADILSEVIKQADEFTEFAVAKRALEVESKGLKSGIDVDAAKLIVENRDPNIERTQNKLVEFQNRNLDYLADSGYINKEDSGVIKELNKDYIPFARIIEETGNPQRKSGKNPIKVFKGSESAIGDPIQAIVSNTDLIMKLAEQNRAVGTFVDGQLARGEDSLIKKSPTPMKAIKVGSEEMSKAFAKEGFQNVSPDAMTIFRPLGKELAENQFAYRRDGKIEVYETDPAIASALNNINLNPVTLNSLQKLLRPFATMQRLGLTTDLGFVGRHMTRNQLVGASFAENAGIPISASQEGMTNLAKRLPFGLMFEGMGHLMKKDEMYYDWMKSGGSRSAYTELNQNYIDKNVWQLSKETGLLPRIWNEVKNPIDALHALATLGDNATSLAQYKRMLPENPNFEDNVKAAMGAREVIPDVYRMGLKMQASNMITAFQNMQIQGMDKVVQMAVDNPGKLTAAALTYITMPSLLLWLANKDDQRVKDQPNYVKDLNWILATDKWENVDADKIPPGLPDYMLRQNNGKTQINNGTLFKFPKPFELGVLFGSFPERILDSFFTDKPEAFKGFAETLMHGALPTMLPSGVVAPIETFANKSMFTGHAIVPESVMGEEPEYRYTEYTSDTAKALSKMIAVIPGLRFRDEIAPPIIDNAVRSWSGTAGQYMLQLTDKALQTAGLAEVKVKPETTLSDIPFVKAFVLRNPSSGMQPIQDFYEDFRKASMVTTTISQEAKKGNSEEALKLMQAPENQQYLLKLQSVKMAMATQSQAIMNIYRNQDFKPAEKRQLIDGLYFQINESAKLGNKMMDDFKKNISDNEMRGTQ